MMLGRRAWSWAAAALIGAVVMGCAAAPPRLATPLGRAQQAVGQAERAGAANEPLAAFHLRLARQQLARGRSAQVAGDAAEAARWFARAEADARVAASRAAESRAGRRADRAHREVEELRIQRQDMRRQPVIEAAPSDSKKTEQQGQP